MADHERGQSICYLREWGKTQHNTSSKSRTMAHYSNAYYKGAESGSRCWATTHFFRGIFVDSMATLRKHLHLELPCIESGDHMWVMTYIHTFQHNNLAVPPTKGEPAECYLWGLTLHLSNCEIFIKPVHSCSGEEHVIQQLRDSILDRWV